jgi:hypothetical protein
MEDRIYHIKISPEVITKDIFPAIWSGGTIIPEPFDDECCDITTTTTTLRITGLTYVYSSMTQLLSGGTNGSSLLTGLTIPIFLTENTVDIGYYSAFDGAISQQDTMLNFVFSAFTGAPYTYYFYNTSDIDFKKYLSFSTYRIDWGDGSPTQLASSVAPAFYTHTYSTTPATYTITMSGMSPWGYNLIKKTVYVPFTGVTIDNPNGEAYFYPSGGNWSATPISYQYIFSGDSVCDVDLQTSDNYTTVPFIVSGLTTSNLKDLEQYGTPKYKLGIQVTGDTGVIGTYWGPDSGNTYTAYTINNVDYYDFSDGTSIFFVYSSGFTSDMISCTAITKNEVLLNVIDQPEIYSSVFIERGKYSGLERVQRLGEIDSIGDLTSYGYKFFNIIKI